MSYVTDVVLITSEYDAEAALARVNAWLRARGDLRNGELHALPSAGHGGERGFAAELAVGGFNYFDEEEFVAALRAMTWDWPERVQVLFRREEEDRFRVRYIGGRQRRMTNLLG